MDDITLHAIPRHGIAARSSSPRFAAIQAAVANPTLQLQLDTSNYPRFDAPLLTTLPTAMRESLANPEQTGLRINLAVLRNTLLLYPAALPGMEGMARQIARVLATSSLAPYREAGSGGALLYQLLLAEQAKRATRQPWLGWWYTLIGQKHYFWKLAPLAATPFSPANLLPDMPLEPLPEEALQEIHDMLDRDEKAPVSIESQEIASVLDALGSALCEQSEMLNSVMALEQPVKRESIDIAKEILRKLKIIAAGWNLDQGITQHSDGLVSLANDFREVAAVYHYHLMAAKAQDPHILRNPAILAANEAIGKMGYACKAAAATQAGRAGDHDLEGQMRQQMQRMPKSWAKPTEKTVGDLLGQVEQGLATALARSPQTTQAMQQRSLQTQAAPQQQSQRVRSSLQDQARQCQRMNQMRQQQRQALLASLHQHDDDDHAQQHDHQQQQAQRAQANRAARQSPRGSQSVSAQPSSTQRTAQQRSSQKSNPFATPAARQASKQAMQAMVQQDMLNQLRHSLATDPHAAHVETGAKHTLQQHLHKHDHDSHDHHHGHEGHTRHSGKHDDTHKAAKDAKKEEEKSNLILPPEPPKSKDKKLMR